MEEMTNAIAGLSARQEETMKRQEETMNAVLELRARQGQAADSLTSHSRTALCRTSRRAASDLYCAVGLAALCCAAWPVWM